ncbi:MAG: hypothetical protein AAF612_08030 [Planctomycetota bacterium]
MAIVHERLRKKVKQVWAELAGEQAARLAHDHKGGLSALRDALLTPDRTDQAAKDIAFHMTDWKDDAAFLLAVHLFPERFTKPEIQAGLAMMLIHAPNHLAAAAKLYGEPVADVFDVGPLTAEAPRGLLAKVKGLIPAPADEADTGGEPAATRDFEPGDRVRDAYGEQATVVWFDPDGALGEGELMVKTDRDEEFGFRLDHAAFEKVE